MDSPVLAINAGSSSIKFALSQRAGAPDMLFSGAISGIGGSHSSFTVHGNAADSFTRQFAIPDHVTATNVLVEWLLGRLQPGALDAIAYRLVYGGPACASSCAIDRPLLAALYAMAPSEPDHLPQEIHLIEVLRRHYPDIAHIACFDSAFHASMPRHAATLPIPRRYHALGLKRYGYHGLSCAYLIGELERLAGPQAAAGKVVIAHLGGGSSVSAIENGLSRDTSMGLSPAGGIMMGTRSGDLDPALAWHLQRLEQMSPGQFHRMVNHESGLLGISGSSADLRVLLARPDSDRNAAEAVEMYCYQVRKAICAMAGAIDGIDTLIFSGGIGENAAPVRARICAGLSHLGVVLDPAANDAAAPVIAAGAVCVRVMRSDEQWMMTQEARGVLATATGAVEECGHD